MNNLVTISAPVATPLYRLNCVYRNKMEKKNVEYADSVRNDLVASHFRTDVYYACVCVAVFTGYKIPHIVH